LCIYLPLVKKALTIFLLFIISTQCLPIKELGKCLYDSSYVEEDADCDGLEKKEGKDAVKEFYFSNMSLQANAKSTPINFVKKNTDLIIGPVSDVTTPPPNA
jgi:hypothetical protein